MGPEDTVVREDSGLDQNVTSAFERLETQFHGEAVIDINPKRFHVLRQNFEISELPAFGILNFEIGDENVEVNTPDLPHWLKFWRWGEREEILSNGKFFPKVERTIIKALSERNDDLFHFIRDLHIVNIDDGLTGVQRRIESELDRLDLKKVIDVVTRFRKVVTG